MRVDVLDWHDISDSFQKVIERDYVVLQKRTKKKVRLAGSASFGSMSATATLTVGSNGWREVTLGECAELIRDSVSPSDMGDALYIGLEHIGEGTLSLLGQGTATDVTSTKARFQRGDILFGKLRPYFRKVVRAPASGLCSTDIWVIRSKDGVNQDYLYYCMATQQFVDFVTDGSEGTRMPRAVWEYASRYNLSLPPLPDQRTIAHVLGTLDDKIELNRRMNETLEAMARALFKSWFVDFEPVRAKMEGRWRRGESLPGLPADLHDLFPDRLVDSELGDIPEGWEVKALRDCIDVERGLSYKGSGLSSSGMPMHNLNSILEGGGYKDEGIKYYDGDYQPRHVTYPGDVIVANTEQGHDRLLIGFAAIVPKRLGDRGLFSHHIYRVRAKEITRLTPDFVCQLLNTQVMHDKISGYATGTTVNMLPIDALRIPSIVAPPIQLVTAFSRIAEAARIRQEQFIQETRSLEAQRDALLPRLVSGEVGVGNVISPVRMERLGQEI